MATSLAWIKRRSAISSERRRCWMKDSGRGVDEFDFFCASSLVRVLSNADARINCHRSSRRPRISARSPSPTFPTFTLKRSNSASVLRIVSRTWESRALKSRRLFSLISQSRAYSSMVAGRGNLSASSFSRLPDQSPKASSSRFTWVVKRLISEFSRTIALSASPNDFACSMVAMSSTGSGGSGWSASSSSILSSSCSRARSCSSACSNAVVRRACSVIRDRISALRLYVLLNSSASEIGRLRQISFHSTSASRIASSRSATRLGLSLTPRM